MNNNSINLIISFFYLLNFNLFISKKEKKLIKLYIK